jgi:hypothetical protein
MNKHLFVPKDASRLLGKKSIQTHSYFRHITSRNYTETVLINAKQLDVWSRCWRGGVADDFQNFATATTKNSPETQYVFALETHSKICYLIKTRFFKVIRNVLGTVH